MEWPIGFLLVVLPLGTAAAAIPWFIPRVPYATVIRVLPALVASIVWWRYEMHLSRGYPAGDPVIRVDLLVIGPLALLAWLSTIAAVVVKHRRERNTEKTAEAAK